MLPGPAGNVVDEVHRVGIPTTLFSALFVQQLVEPVDLLANADPKYDGRANNAHQDQDCGNQCCQIRVVDAALGRPQMCSYGCCLSSCMARATQDLMEAESGASSGKRTTP